MCPHERTARHRRGTRLIHCHDATQSNRSSRRSTVALGGLRLTHPGLHNNFRDRVPGRHRRERGSLSTTSSELSPRRGPTARNSSSHWNGRCEGRGVDTGPHPRDPQPFGPAGMIHFPHLLVPGVTLAILFAHRFGDHSGRWQHYGEQRAAGCALFAGDHRGRALSDGEGGSDRGLR